MVSTPLACRLCIVVFSTRDVGTLSVVNKWVTRLRSAQERVFVSVSQNLNDSVPAHPSRGLAACGVFRAHSLRNSQRSPNQRSARFLSRCRLRRWFDLECSLPSQPAVLCSSYAGSVPGSSLLHGRQRLP